jgi:UDP-GlcNAc:undecaprenyl-phosphate GlcNAc-1-phosphate transferase
VLAGYAAVFGVAFVTTLVLTPIVRRLAIRRGLLVAPGERLVHEKPMPNLGGIAMVCGVMAGMLVAALMSDFNDVFKSSTSPPS